MKWIHINICDIVLKFLTYLSNGIINLIIKSYGIVFCSLSAAFLFVY